MIDTFNGNLIRVGGSKTKKRAVDTRECGGTRFATIFGYEKRDNATGV